MRGPCIVPSDCIDDVTSRPLDSTDRNGMSEQMTNCWRSPRHDGYQGLTPYFGHAN
jgi:hypothetical protein